MKDFFGTVIEPGDAVIIAKGQYGHEGYLVVGTFTGEDVSDELHDLYGGRFGNDQIISMKSIAAGKVVAND